MLGVFFGLLLGLGVWTPELQAQAPEEAEKRFTEAMREDPSTAPPPEAESVPASQELPPLNLLEIALSGGPLMYPILLMSVLVVLFSVERFLGLRRNKILPPGLLAELDQLVETNQPFDPRLAYRVCHQYPSAAGEVLQGLLLKLGRPHSELEHALDDGAQREMASLYKNVRPIELAISVAPLLGLLGTVQGMIMAFYRTANTTMQTNRAEQLADGIYIALVTTFAGLCVAIPAAVLAHYFEGKIQSLIRDLDEWARGFLPILERFEGKIRVSRKTYSRKNEGELHLRVLSDKEQKGSAQAVSSEEEFGTGESSQEDDFPGLKHQAVGGSE